MPNALIELLLCTSYGAEHLTKHTFLMVQQPYKMLQRGGDPK